MHKLVHIAREIRSSLSKLTVEMEGYKIEARRSIFKRAIIMLRRYQMQQSEFS